MTNLKYEILTEVHDAPAAFPASRTAFYAKAKDLNGCKKGIDELISSGLLVQAVGSDSLAVTPVGVEMLEVEEKARAQIRSQTVRYWITTVIAAAALILSVIALTA